MGKSIEAKAPRGTNDILPGESGRWQLVEGLVRQIFATFGYDEIRTPIFEHTEVFARGIGQGTDIVEKEMYTFEDRSGRSLTLRPEGTAAVVRAFLEHKLYAGPLPWKVYYIGPMFRYERPQAGRYRQFYQLGAEAIGSDDPSLDAEMVVMPLQLYRRLGLTRFEVHLNSIGCPHCRPAYRERLLAYLSEQRDRLCPTCQSRLTYNPLRVLDCKEERCAAVTSDAPRTVDHLCEACREHFAAVQAYLQTAGVKAVVDHRLVRGLDYYSRTVFEIHGLDLGAQNALGGGGRYDGLVEELGGPALPAVGFAVGMERLLLALAGQGVSGDEARRVDVFVAVAGEGVRLPAWRAILALRAFGWRVETDYGRRSLKAQLRGADRLGARWVVIFGEAEWATGTVLIRDLQSGRQESLPVHELESWARQSLAAPATLRSSDEPIPGQTEKGVTQAHE